MPMPGRGSAPLLLRWGLAAVVAALLLTMAGVAHLPSTPTHDSTLAPTPPMGWNSWNQVGCSGLTQAVVEAAADHLVSTGLNRAGYSYVVVDDCWQGPRDSAGELTADPTRFPSGMAALADYVHARGLRFGIYAAPGSQTCANYYAGYPVRGIGSLGHEQQDADTFARWGVDYLKYDWCRANLTDGLHERTSLAQMSAALRSTGRAIVYSISEYGVGAPWNWAPGVAQLWRTGHDIHPTRASIVGRIDSQAPLAAFARPGAWNDPDMLEIGNAGLTDAETRTHFGMWCMLAAPLMLGTDLGALAPATLDAVGNRDVIAVDQDALGRQATRVADDGAHSVWVKPLARGDLAVALLNTSDSAATLSTTLSAIGAATGPWRTHDLWSGTRSMTSDRLSARVQPHGMALFRLSRP
jgi:alpha-galactosidase